MHHLFNFENQNSLFSVSDTNRGSSGPPLPLVGNLREKALKITSKGIGTKSNYLWNIFSGCNKKQEQNKNIFRMYTEKKIRTFRRKQSCCFYL